MTEHARRVLNHAEKARMHGLLADHEDAHAKGEHPAHGSVKELHELVAANGERDSLLLEGRIPLTAAEHAAVDKLIAQSPGKPVGLTRRDPGETGPLIAHVDGQEWEITADGKRKKVN